MSGPAIIDGYRRSRNYYNKSSLYVNRPKFRRRAELYILGRRLLEVSEFIGPAPSGPSGVGYRLGRPPDPRCRATHLKCSGYSAETGLAVDGAPIIIIWATLLDKLGLQVY